MSDPQISYDALVANVEEFENGKTSKRRQLCDLILAKLEPASKRGERKIQHALTGEYTFLLKDQSPISKRLDERFRCYVKEGHAFQCDCDKQEGCVTWLVIEY
jgi:hypothetical protein